jgi:hypothetical protein
VVEEVLYVWFQRVEVGLYHTFRSCTMCTEISVRLY